MSQLSSKIGSTSDKQTNNIHPYCYPCLLKDGTQIVIRSVKPDDEASLLEFQESLSEQTVYTRYFSWLPLEQRINHERLAHDCIDDLEQITLIAESQKEHPDYPHILGIVQLIHKASTRQGEFSIAVCDASQGKGLGTLFMSCLEVVARERGVNEIIGYILPTNNAMLSICKKLGYIIKYDNNLKVMIAIKKL